MRVIWVGLFLGMVLNVLGWLGNVFLLGQMWKEAFVDFPATAWRETIWRDVVSFLPDLIYGVCIAWLYVALARPLGPTVSTAFKATALVFLAGVFTSYLGIANSGLLPWGISAATTFLALVTFIPGALIVHALLKGFSIELNDT